MKSGSALGVQAEDRMSPLRFRGEREFPRSVVSRSRRSFPAFPATFPSIRFLRKKRSRRVPVAVLGAVPVAARLGVPVVRLCAVLLRRVFLSDQLIN